ncbi:MAG TPA: alpha/beta fold hydrolase [Caulobacter sp.]|nr:alpha/beta fold hydrolase [Caulobacter sp.]
MTTFVDHAYEERTIDLGEVAMNHVVVGSPDRPALLLIPGQTESWWGYEQAIALLAPRFQVFAVDLRGQGRSTRTPGRYSLNTLGGDLVRFIQLAVGRPVVVSGNSSGGVLAAWLSAYAMPGQIRGVCCEDAPFFASEARPKYGPGIRQAAGPIFRLMAKHLGEQWSIGDWASLKAAQAADDYPVNRMLARAAEPPQNLREYDPEWGKAFWDGTIALNCPHERMLASARTPMLFTHHMRVIDPASGALIGAITDFQVAKARELVTGAGQPFELVDAPDALHSMHAADPVRFAKILTDWAEMLPT